MNNNSSDIQKQIETSQELTANDIHSVFANLKLPTQEELEEKAKLRYQEAFSNPNQFEHWFPVVKEVLDSESVPVQYPKSNVFPLSKELFDLVLKEDLASFENHSDLLSLVDFVKEAFIEFESEQLFMKNSLFSGKHSWVNTCLVKKNSKISNHIGNILYNWALNSGDYPTSMVVRELINTKPLFHAFDGMPVTQEFRMFAKDGVSHSYQAYWVKDAIIEPDDDNWESLLESVEKPTDEILDVMVLTSNLVTEKLGGDWSVDFLIDAEGNPWLIDMAITSQSYISPELVKL